MLVLADKDVKRDSCVSHIQKLERKKACKVEIGRYFMFKKNIQIKLLEMKTSMSEIFKKDIGCDYQQTL